MNVIITEIIDHLPGEYIFYKIVVSVKDKQGGIEYCKLNVTQRSLWLEDISKLQSNEETCYFNAAQKEVSKINAGTSINTQENVSPIKS